MKNQKGEDFKTKNKFLTWRNIGYFITAYFVFLLCLELYNYMFFKSENPISVPKCQEYEGLQIADFDLVPKNYTGFVKKCSGEFIEKLGEYKNGKHHGFFRKWDSGWIQSELHFKDGLLDGLSREWDYGEEMPKIEYNFRKGELHGLSRERKKFEEVDGIYKYGELYVSLESHYNMGIKHGLEKHYYPEINTIKHDTYEYGKLNGVSRTYWKNKLIIENTYRNNKLHGKCSKWNRNFYKEHVKTYNQGVVIDAKCWDASGNLIRCFD